MLTDRICSNVRNLVICIRFVTFVFVNYFLGRKNYFRRCYLLINKSYLDIMSAVVVVVFIVVFGDALGSYKDFSLIWRDIEKKYSEHIF